jgi:hypothetical protein
MSLNTLFNELAVVRGIWDRLNLLLIEGGYDFERQRPGLYGESLSVFAKRVDYVLELLGSLKPDGEVDINTVVIGARMVPLRSALNSFQRNADAVLSQVSSGWAPGRRIQDGNDTFLIQILQEGTVIQQHDCSSSFAEMNGAMSSLVEILGSLLPLCRTNSVGDFFGRVSELNELVRQSKILFGGLSSDKLAMGALVESAAAMEKDVRAAHIQSQTLITSLREVQLNASSDFANVTGLLERIRSVSSDAEKLNAFVVASSGKLEAFLNEIETRNQAFEKYEQHAKVVNQTNQENASEIKRLSALADSMIAGANTVGIAVSMEEARLRYEKRMGGAAIGFVSSIALLAISALPLAAHLVPGLLGDWGAVTQDGGNTPWYSVVGKFLLLAPATWLTGFFTKAFADYFHLEREYAHKAAIAKSVEGFRRQAPRYEQEITAEVFLEVRTNPARDKAAEPVAHPVYDFLSKALGKFLEKKVEG